MSAEPLRPTLERRRHLDPPVVGPLLVTLVLPSAPPPVTVTSATVPTGIRIPHWWVWWTGPRRRR